ncbi:MAG: hypothetical protein BGP13_12270 [Sphingobacteriales bacterium 40-81]|nr:MAG: hypothetical protein BGP13_12270 [Sphingobacteriales bacterium 40-81]
MYASLYQFASLFAAVSFFIPILLLWVKGLMKNRILVWFGLYWCWAGLVNIVCSAEVIKQSMALNIIERLYNLADIPFMLFILYSTTEIDGIRKSLRKILIPLLCVEIGASIVSWFMSGVETVIVFGGVLLVLYYVLWTIINYSRKNSFSESHTSYQYIYYALLFEYATSIITVIYSYIMPERANTDDSFMIFYISTIIAIATASAGILTYQEQKPQEKIKGQKFQPEAEIRYL